METWSPHVKKCHDRHGDGWHFLFQHRILADRAPDEQPYALFFRNEEATVFGVLRFERADDNPYGDFAAITRKIMDDDGFRESLLDSGSQKVWKGR